MKKIFLVLTVMALTTFFATAQNIMEFSRVLLVESLDTVPQGKIWKVSNIMQTQFSHGYNQENHLRDIIINGNIITVSYSVSSNNNVNYYNHTYDYNGLQGAYWLPEGTTLQAGTNVQYISVIEFNIQ
jgi:hypothetical protein